MGKVQAVVFDFGETLVNETRMWETVAKVSGVPFFTLAGVLGAGIERRTPHRAVFDELGIAPIEPFQHGYVLGLDDFYPDGIEALTRLHARGLRLGIAGNQPSGVVEQLSVLGLPLDLIASSSTLGVSKPDPRFFEQIVTHLNLSPNEIVYVGDRLDNDVLPALSLGMHAVFIKRGPWGYIHSSWPQAHRVQHTITSLAEIEDIIDRIEADDRT
ncbi:MAG: HAD family hydrolase [Thermomicrobiales bacterium]